MLFVQGLPLVDDGNSLKFFCALRLVVENQEVNQQKLFPQSARTKCVQPLIVRVDDLDEGMAKWNELFIFEVPRKVCNNLLSAQPNRRRTQVGKQEENDFKGRELSPEHP